MKRSLYIIIGIVLFIACGERQEYVSTLERAEVMMNDYPDSALAVLDSLSAHEQEFGKRLRMRYQLLRLQAQNKAFIPFTSDSLAKDVVSYFDRHGNHNDQMKAHYLLGCVYRDLGEAPHAVDCYIDAISKADTTAKDCDFSTLSSVYSQMAEICHQQLLLSNAIEFQKKASHFALLANQKYWSVYNIERLAGTYILMDKRDSAELLLKRSIAYYTEDSLVKDRLRASKLLMYLYVGQTDRLDDAKPLIDDYDKGYHLFDSNVELSPSKRQYFYYKGRYYEGVNNLDSAEFYYRKILRPKMSFVQKDPMYRGLLSVYSKRHIADSIAKYAKLYCEVNDSSIAKKDQQLTAQMAASYNYNRYQKEAMDNESKANKIRMVLLAFAFFVILAAIIIWNRFQNTKRKKQEEIENLKEEHIRATDEYCRNLYIMQVLDKSRQQDINLMQKDSIDYENKLTELKDENQRLERIINNIEQQKGFAQYLANTTEFMQTKIVSHLKEMDFIPLSTMTEKDWEELDEQVRKYFPHILLDLHNTPKITKQKIQVCLLVILKVSDGSISNWLNLKPSRVSNIKSDLNHTLFDDNSARTLYNNLRHKYNIISNLK